MSRKPRDGKSHRKMLREMREKAAKAELPKDLGKRTIQGVLIDETQWEGHDL